MRKTLKSVLVGTSVLWLVACTSGPELQKYPRAHIDRPYTLPKGVAAWKTAVLLGRVSDTSGSITLPPIPIPLFWDMSLSDEWTLHWAPLPLSASHQLSQTKEQLWGVSFGIGGGYASGDFGGVVSPAAHLYNRWRLSDTIALETKPFASASFYTKNRDPRWTLGLSVGPLFQLTPTFAVSPRVTVNYQRGYDATLLENSGTLSTITGNRVTLPLGLEANWSLARQWDLEGDYTFSRIGHLNDYTAHIGTLWLKHYW